METSPITISSSLIWARHQLESQESGLDAELLLAHLIKRPRSYLHAWPERQIDATTWLNLQRLIARRRAGEPLAYLTGEREFWSLTLHVTPATLVPRPETELLVETALALLPEKDSCQLADLGTGSGAIALAIAHQRPAWGLIATDRCEQALAVARTNAERHGLSNVEFRQGSWCDPLATTDRGDREEAHRFHLILSNPPYLAEQDPHLSELGAEPRGALVAGRRGLEAIEQIVACAPRYLRGGGWLLLEHGCEQSESVRSIMANAGLTQLETHRDLAGHPRVTKGRERAV